MAEKKDWSKKLQPNDSNISEETDGKSDTDLGQPNQTGPLSKDQQGTPGSIQGRKAKASHEDKP